MPRATASAWRRTARRLGSTEYRSETLYTDAVVDPIIFAIPGIGPQLVPLARLELVSIVHTLEFFLIGRRDRPTAGSKAVVLRGATTSIGKALAAFEKLDDDSREMLADAAGSDDDHPSDLDRSFFVNAQPSFGRERVRSDVEALTRLRGWLAKATKQASKEKAPRKKGRHKLEPERLAVEQLAALWRVFTFNLGRTPKEKPFGEFARAALTPLLAVYHPSVPELSTVVFDALFAPSWEKRERKRYEEHLVRARDQAIGTVRRS